MRGLACKTSRPAQARPATRQQHHARRSQRHVTRPRVASLPAGAESVQLLAQLAERTGEVEAPIGLAVGSEWALG